MKSLSGSITIDESNVYAWTSEVKISKSKGKLQLNPMFEIRQPGMDTVQMKGFVSMVNGMKSLDMDLSLTGLQDLPYNLMGGCFLHLNSSFRFIAVCLQNNILEFVMFLSLSPINFPF